MPTGLATVGVRELRQNLSVYLARVKKGTTFKVSEHGHVVAELRPLAPSDDHVARLVAEGKVTPPKRGAKGRPRPLKLSPEKIEKPVSVLLDELRGDSI